MIKTASALICLDRPSTDPNLVETEISPDQIIKPTVSLRGQANISKLKYQKLWGERLVWHYIQSMPCCTIHILIEY